MYLRPGDLVRLGEFNTFSNEEFYDAYAGELFQVEDYDLSDDTILVCEEWCRTEDVTLEEDQTQVPFDNRYFDRDGHEVSREEYLYIIEDDEDWEDENDDEENWDDEDWDDEEGDEDEIYDGTDEWDDNDDEEDYFNYYDETSH